VSHAVCVAQHVVVPEALHLELLTDEIGIASRIGALPGVSAMLAAVTSITSRAE
jgi:hypothetical protein